MVNLSATSVSRQNDSVVIKLLESRINLPEQASVLSEEFLQAADLEPGTVVLDFENVEFLASPACIPLVRLHKHLRGQSRRLAITRLRPQLRRVLEVTRMVSTPESQGLGIEILDEPSETADS